MQNTSNYGQIIFRNHVATLIIVFFALISAAGCIIFLIRSEDFLNKNLRMLLIFTCLILIIAILLLSISLLSDAYYDIRNQAYISVTGEITVSEPFEIIVNRSTSSDTKTVKIYHSNGTIDELELRMNVVSIPNGSYVGRIVYSERTKILVDWEEIAVQ